MLPRSYEPYMSNPTQNDTTETPSETPPSARLDEINQQLAEAYPDLSPQLQLAEVYVLEHPLDIAFQSIRKSAAAAAVTGKLTDVRDMM